MAQRTLPQFLGDVWGAVRGFNREERRMQRRGFDGASLNRFSREARSGRMTQETLAARPVMAARGLYYYGSEPYAKAGVDALVTYGWGAGAMVDHARADAFAEWGESCDADGLQPFDALFASAIREMIVTGECLILFIVEGGELKLRLIPASQLDDSLSRDLGNGRLIDAGIEKDARGRRVAYHIKPALPTTQFESYSAPIRVDARDVVHLFRPVFVGQVRGISWLHAILLKLADTGLLGDALLKNFQISALNSVYLIDRDGATGVPFAEGEQDGEALAVSLEPGAARILRGNWDFKANTPQQASQSIEFLNAQVNAISAGLGVCAHMVSGDVSRCNYSSLRADLLKMKASVEAWQYATLVPALNAIFRRWALVESLRGGGEIAGTPEWRFPAFPSADAIKDVQATVAMLDAKLMSRREAIAARGESIERVDSDIASDPHAQTASDDPETEEEAPDAE